MGDIELHGYCDPQFSAVEDIFRSHFESGEELGAGVHIQVAGETVVELWAGYADAARSRAWERDTMACVYSCTKGITALAIHRLIDEGRLELDAPVAHYWPEFAAAGKSELPVRYLLSHQAGLAAIRKPVRLEDLYDWDFMATALAEQTPWWEPGTDHGYHAFTFGQLLGELIRRITGASPGSYVRKEIAEPLGVRFEIGTGPELDSQIAELVDGPVASPDAGSGFDLTNAILSDLEGLTAKTFANPPALGAAIGNSRAWRAAQLPAANGHTNAAGLATIYGTLANGGVRDGYRLLSQEGIERARGEQVRGPCRVLTLDCRIGLGYFLADPENGVGDNPRAFGHAGAGGSYGHADPERKLGLGYVMNYSHSGAWIIDPRPKRLLNAALASL